MRLVRTCIKFCYFYFRHTHLNGCCTHLDACVWSNKKSRTYGTSDLSVRPIWESDLRVRSVRPWEADLWGRIRPPTASHGLPWPHRLASHGLPRPPTASQIGLTDLDSLIGSDRSHEKMWEAECMGGRGRPNSASHGLSDPVSSHLIGWQRESEAMGGRGRPWEAKFGLPCTRPPTFCDKI